jgi:hypothetical protein
MKPDGPQSQSLLLLAALALCGCEGRDTALQQELAELREQARTATEQAEAANSRLAQIEIQSAEALEASIKEAARSLEKNLATAFPGYRAGSIRHGRFVFLIGETESPYRTTLEFALKPSSPSALTPEMPPVSIEVAADPRGSWTMPGQPRLRELQAAASASASAQAEQFARQQKSPQPAPQAGSPAPRPTPRAPAPPQPPTDPNTRVISWGDAPPETPPAPPQTPQTPQSPQSPPPDTPVRHQPTAPVNAPGLPKADRTYEIRFD